MRYGELKKLLKKNGCVLYREGKRHEVWFSPKTKKYFSVGRHNSEEAATGTVQAIKRDAGIE